MPRKSACHLHAPYDLDTHRYRKHILLLLLQMQMRMQILKILHSIWQVYILQIISLLLLLLS